jgi:hypothetical protein
VLPFSNINLGAERSHVHLYFPKDPAMTCKAAEPSLCEALSDPVIRAVMKADGVDPVTLAADLRRVARNLRHTDIGRSERI